MLRSNPKEGPAVGVCLTSHAHDADLIWDGITLARCVEQWSNSTIPQPLSPHTSDGASSRKTPGKFAVSLSGEQSSWRVSLNGRLSVWVEE